MRTTRRLTATRRRARRRRLPSLRRNARCEGQSLPVSRRGAGGERPLVPVASPNSLAPHARTGMIHVTTQPDEFFPEEIIAVTADVAGDFIDQGVTLTQWMQAFGRATPGAVCFVKAGGTR